MTQLLAILQYALLLLAILQTDIANYDRFILLAYPTDALLAIITDVLLLLASPTDYTLTTQVRALGNPTDALLAILPDALLLLAILSRLHANYTGHSTIWNNTEPDLEASREELEDATLKESAKPKGTLEEVDEVKDASNHGHSTSLVAVDLELKRFGQEEALELGTTAVDAKP